MQIARCIFRLPKRFRSSENSCYLGVGQNTAEVGVFEFITNEMITVVINH